MEFITDTPSASLLRNEMFLNLEKAWEDRNVERIMNILRDFIEENDVVDHHSSLYKMFFEENNPDLETFLLLMWGLDIRPKFVLAIR